MGALLSYFITLAQVPGLVIDSHATWNVELDRLPR